MPTETLRIFARKGCHPHVYTVAAKKMASMLDEITPIIP